MARRNLTTTGAAMANFVRFDGMTWPRTDTEVGWTLRYGNPTRSDILLAAEIVAAYEHLVVMTQRERDRRVSSIRAAIGRDDG